MRRPRSWRPRSPRVAVVLRVLNDTRGDCRGTAGARQAAGSGPGAGGRPRRNPSINPARRRPQLRREDPPASGHASATLATRDAPADPPTRQRRRHRAFGAPVALRICVKSRYADQKRAVTDWLWPGWPDLANWSSDRIGQPGRPSQAPLTRQGPRGDPHHRCAPPPADPTNRGISKGSRAPCNRRTPVAISERQETKDLTRR